MTDIPVTRFKVGATYRLRSSPDFPRMLGGTMTVRSEIKPADRWGNRIILADAILIYPNGRLATKPSARFFVEEGVSEGMDGMDKTEIASLQGIYPNFAKAYAADSAATKRVA